MKKLLFTLVALCATMSIEAQTIKIYDNDDATPVAVYNNGNGHKYKVVYMKIPVTSVTLNKKKTSILVGSNITLTATIAPDNATNKTINWTSSDTDVATVDANGKVTGVARGTATITATSSNGISATCSVTVITIDDTTGKAFREDGVEVNWVQLWLNGPKFAEYNIGASKAEDYSGIYTWGGMYKNGPRITWTDDHNTSNTGSGNLSSSEDTATKLWGSNWRMPTKAELEGLLANCTCTMITRNGVKGLLCKGNGTAYKDNSVFLPAAGNYYYKGFYGQGSIGRYWSSTPKGSDSAYRLYFGSGNPTVGFNDRDYGCSVRAVLKE